MPRDAAPGPNLRTWLLAALRPFRVDPSYFDDLGGSLDRSAPPDER